MSAPDEPRPATPRMAQLMAVTFLSLTVVVFSQSTPVPDVDPATFTDTIGGQVVDDMGLPIEGARIEIEVVPSSRSTSSVLPAGYRTPAPVKSDPEGTWQMKRVPVGVVPDSMQTLAAREDTFRLCITHPEFLTREFSSMTRDSIPEAELRGKTAKIVLQRGHIVRGVVRDELGLGIPDATVERNPGMIGRSDPAATTNAVGRYVLKAARPGSLNMRVRAPGCAVLLQRVDVQADTTLDFTLKPAKTLTLHLRDEQGRPVTRGWVNFMQDEQARTRAERYAYARPDAEGRVIWDEAPDTEVFAGVFMEGFEPLKQKVKAGAETALTLRRRPQPPVITLKVTEAGTGKPLSGCTIETGLVLRQFPTVPATAPHPEMPLWGIESSGAVKPGSAEGEYRAAVSDFAQKNLLKFRVRCPGHAPVQTATLDPQKGDATIHVTLQPSAPTTITVLGLDGKPADKASVHVVWSQRLVDRRSTTGQNRDAAAMLAPFFLSRDVEFSGSTDAQGRCVLPSSADEATVIVRHDAGVASAAFADAAKDGVMRLQPYRFASEKEIMDRIVALKTDKRPFVQLKIQLTQEGRPVPDGPAVILSCAASGESGDVVTSTLNHVAQGMASLSIKPGPRLVQVGRRMDDGTCAFTPVLTTDLKPESATQITAALQPGLRVAGRVAEEVPRPVKGAKVFVHVSSNGQGGPGRLTWSHAVPLREDGTFEFPSLPPGHMRFLVLAEGWTSPLDILAKNQSSSPWSAGAITEPRDGLVIPMQRTAACEVTVVDAQGRPVPGASVSLSTRCSPDGFSVHLLRCGGGPSTMQSTEHALEEVLTDKGYSVASRSSTPIQAAVTDAEGRALLRDVPALVDSSTVRASATPNADGGTVRVLSGTAGVEKLQPGETGKVTVRLDE